MIMNFNLKLIKSTLCILSVLIASFAHAEPIELLQKNASVAYEKMMKAKQTAESLAKDATFAEKKLVSAKQKMMKAEREAETAKRKSEQAKIAMEQAINRWKQASDMLANEWGTSEVK